MGMYDYIKCEYPLPDAHMQDALFQTKDTEAMYLEHYTITRDGKLVHHGVAYGETPPEERPYYDPEIKGFKSAVDEFCGSISETPTGDIEIPYHGDVYFYTSVGWFADGTKTYRISDGQGQRVTDGPWESATEEWFEYQARFTNGRVEWIRRVDNT